MHEFINKAEFILDCPRCKKMWAYSHAEFIEANGRVFQCSCGNILPLLEEYMSMPQIVKMDSYVPLLENK